MLTILSLSSIVVSRRQIEHHIVYREDICGNDPAQSARIDDLFSLDTHIS